MTKSTKGYAGREGDIVTGMIQQTDARYTLLDLGRVEALLRRLSRCPLNVRRPMRASRRTSWRSARPPRAPRSWLVAPIRVSSSAYSNSRCLRSPTVWSRFAPAPVSPDIEPRSPCGPTTPT
ncbi:MAG: hypothetical protein Ct9H300mP12_16450 [Acidimicrobiales bacterium]|nr:MAG: hypothetical protein Ct9H300mP12_16450 [Acidimicrobiales bacterium]